MTESAHMETSGELSALLGVVEGRVGARGASDLAACREMLRSFHTAAAMEGEETLAEAGRALDAFLPRAVGETAEAEAASVFGFAVNALAEGMRRGDGNAASREALSILSEVSAEEAGGGGDSPEEDEAALLALVDVGPPTGEVPDLARLLKALQPLGGEVSLHRNGHPGGTVTLAFPVSALSRIESLLAPAGGACGVEALLSGADPAQGEILDAVRGFMEALSAGDMAQAQAILLGLSEPRRPSGLYNEIGALARELHTSLCGFMETMDPALKEMVQDRIPDSGMRLEHILEMTEKAANTTLDLVEGVQRRAREESGHIETLGEVLAGLAPLGSAAAKRIEKGREAAAALGSLVSATHDDLGNIILAQDYQDRTGQVIQKIIGLLKDLELKLVNVIRTFGVKIEGAAPPQDNLYGPALEGQAGALHSQDAVDSLLAEFGF